MKNFINRPILLISLFLIAALIPKNATAFEIRSGDNIEILKKETVNENILVTGQTVFIEGKINGDLFCFGQTIEIKGDIDGDVICAAQSIILSGSVSGSLRTASQNLQLKGSIDRNVTSAAQNLSTLETTMVLGELAFAAQKADISGVVGGKLVGAAQDVNINGSVGSDIYLDVESLSLSDDTSVAGSIIYVSEKSANQGKAKINGAVTKKQPVRQKENPDEKKNPIQDFAGAVVWQSILVFALVYFLKDVFDYTYEEINSHPIKSAGQGFVMLIIPPVIILLLIFTIVGMPLAFTVLCLYILSFFAARAIICIYIGRYIIDRFVSVYSGNHYLYGLVGVIVSWIIGRLPIVGGLFGFILMLIGFGGVFSLLNSIKQRQHKKPSASSPGPLIA